ncbi:MAG: alpha-L-rhamnosidase C-terminal domain-containing protein, partial [Marinoscillum sp.]
DAFATLAFQYQSETRDTLIVHIGEQLVDNHINRDPQGTIRYQKIKVPVSPEVSEYALQIKPDKRNTKSVAIQLPDSFPVLMPFRYAELEGAQGQMKAEDFTQLFYHGYWEDDASYFTCSDSTLNRIWDLCKYSIKATTFAGLYVDGDRERIPYEADAYLNQLSHYTTDREYAMARRTVEYFMKHPTWPTEWQLHVALMFHADYLYTGNTELVTKYYEELKHKTLMELRGEDGLISSENATPAFMEKLGFTDPKDRLKDIVDWPPAQKDTGWKLATEEGERDGFVFKPINTVVNCFYYRNLEIITEFARLLNKHEEAKELQQLTLKVRQAINDQLFDERAGVYVDGVGTDHASLHSNMLALAFNIVPEEHVKSVADFIKSRGMACSVYGSQYLLEAMYNANEGDYALQLMTATHDRSWYNMIEIGSTMTLEAWDMKYKPNSDWNHAWGATPANIIPRYLWGIQPKTPGCTTVTIRPQMGGLTSSAIKVPTIRGSIKADYVRHPDETESYHVEIPANMSGEFYFKRESVARVVLNGVELDIDQDIILLQPGVNDLELF